MVNIKTKFAKTWSSIVWEMREICLHLQAQSRTIICVNMEAADSTEIQAPNYMAHLNHRLRITLYTTFSNLTFKEEQFETELKLG
jgi:hypothetical protein